MKVGDKVKTPDGVGFVVEIHQAVRWNGLYFEKDLTTDRVQVWYGVDNTPPFGYWSYGYERSKVEVVE